MRKLLIIAWLMILFAGISALFWYNEWQYTLPTPIPSNYISIKNGQHIAVDKKLEFNNSKPLFLHFFNPDCPCSRFNITHFKQLVKQYGGQANFVVVLLTDKYYTVKEVQNKFDLNVRVVVDPEIALKCGVYATPQAAIITNQHQLYYRGNYNRSRYCTNEKTEYAKTALQAMLQHQQTVVFNQFASQAYGCSLPNCKK